jgi:Ni,Fe-hydrogenase I cytochrome b subunit
MSVSIDTADNATSSGRGASTIHPLIVRITHWVNAVAMVIIS